ncbi:MAG: glycerol-3-phosphate 1-O-acyltransferase PlsB [Pseudomonadales bacterium]|nr:glycerol-3-phosphate 1-O-acyltransferase PlsB [Pseudomonadales bacterium]MDG1442123.1 glycerol-3-phosphate 1-O-acyltransferase PlsB [Pseudomonadales bacterium]
MANDSPEAEQLDKRSTQDSVSIDAFAPTNIESETDQRPPGFFKKTSLRIKASTFSLSKSILFSWIRPTILGNNADYLSLQPNDLVCYVMPFQSTTDLLVLEQSCIDAGLPKPTAAFSEKESRSFFFLGHPEGTFGRKTLRQQSARMQRLLQYQSENEHQSSSQENQANIKIVPVSLFWGHQPDREKSLFKIILSDNWTVTSRFKKLMSAVFYRSHILIQFSQPVSLADLVTSEPDIERQKRKLMRLLRVHFNRQKQAILGPDLSHRRTLLNTLMKSEAVQTAILNEVSKTQKTQHKVEKQALGYANEIASHQSYRVIRSFQILLTWLWNKLYDGINVINIDIPKEIAKSHEIIYIPCHRSHIDYLLLSYVLYNNGLTPPHIAAGKNLNLPIVGSILRRAGAFYMRRSFHGDLLYKAVFDEYLHLMFTKGYSVEYFIEGGRSRTGRTLSPRTGMLSMTVSSFRRDPVKNIAFLPVYFGYERILEGSTYQGELSGKTKQDESIFDIFGIFSTFKKAFGQVDVSFGAPLYLNEFLDDHLPDWKQETNQALTPTSMTQTHNLLAVKLAERINDAATINPTNLVATALLCTPKQTIGEQRLRNQVKVLRAISRLTRADSTTVTTLNEIEIIKHAEQVAGLDRISHHSGDILTASATTAIALTYYRNNTLHIFALASLIARIIRFKGSVSVAEINENCEIIYPFLAKELFLNISMQDLPERIANTIEVLIAVGLVMKEADIVSTTDQTSDGFASLTELAEIVEPCLERFHIVLMLIADKDIRSSKEIEASALDVAQRLSLIFGINSPEFFDRSLFARFMTALSATDSITKTDQTWIPSDGFTKLHSSIDSLLDTSVRFNVIQSLSHR